MTIYKRILHILIAAGLVAVAILLGLDKEDGPTLIAGILGFTMFVYGIQCLVTYFLKFRYMVGGRSQLYIGILSMDVGLLIINSYNESSFLILIYLLGFRLVSGGIDLARAIVARKNGAPWKAMLVSGIISLATVVIVIIFIQRPKIVVDVYCISLFISAAEHIWTAFRRTKVVTIA